MNHIEKDIIIIITAFLFPDNKIVEIIIINKIIDIENLFLEFENFLSASRIIGNRTDKTCPNIGIA